MVGLVPPGAAGVPGLRGPLPRPCGRGGCARACLGPESSTRLPPPRGWEGVVSSGRHLVSVMGCPDTLVVCQGVLKFTRLSNRVAPRLVPGWRRLGGLGFPQGRRHRVHSRSIAPRPGVPPGVRPWGSSLIVAQASGAPIYCILEGCLYILFPAIIPEIHKNSFLKRTPGGLLACSVILPA